LPIQNTEGLLVTNAERSAHCAGKLRSREAGIWFDHATVLHQYHLEHCDEFHKVDYMGDPSIVFGIALKDSPAHQTLLPKLNAAIAWYIQSQKWRDLRRNEWKTGLVCPVKEVSDTAAVSLRSMSGLFIVYGAVTALSFGCALVVHWKSDCHNTASDDHAPPFQTTTSTSTIPDVFALNNDKQDSLQHELQVFEDVQI
jgi:hypothetical protein